MPKFPVLDRIKVQKRRLIERGADPHSIILVMSDLSYHKLHSALQKISGNEILILHSFDGMEIVVHEQCDDDQMFILDKRHWDIKF